MGVVYLVRHGQSISPVVDQLTDLGRAQAQHAGRYLRERAPDITYVLSGTLSRQSETADIILGEVATAATPARTTDELWNEYQTHWLSDASAHYDAANAKAFQASLNAALHSWIAGAGDPNMETFQSYWGRVSSALVDLERKAESGTTTVVVSSAGTIAAIVAQLWDVAPSVWPVLAQSILNTSVSKLVVGRTGTTVVSFNEHSHVDVPAGDSSRRLMTYR